MDIGKAVTNLKTGRFMIKKEGGDAIEADISDVRDMAEQVARVCDEQIICFDILKTTDGYKIIDENNFPGLYADILKEHQYTIADLFVDVIKKNIKMDL